MDLAVGALRASDMVKDSLLVPELMVLMEGLSESKLLLSVMELLDLRIFWITLLSLMSELLLDQDVSASNWLVCLSGVTAGKLGLPELVCWLIWVLGTR